jgi:DNA-binding CsgD family transcriptional regulator
VQRRALEAALLLGEAHRGVERLAVASAFLAALRTLATAGPLCVAVDDLQWLDAESLGVVRYALARLGDAPVAALVAVRGAPPEWVRRSVGDERLTEIHVDGLSLGATSELLRSRLGSAPPRPTTVRIWETSRGNPFFALELGHALEARGGGGVLAPSEDLPIPFDLDELLRQRLAALAPAGLDVAQAVAAAFEPTVTVVERVVGASFDDGLAETLSAHVLEVDGERLRFTHPLLGSALSSWLTPGRRRTLHARLAAIVPSPEARARHLALAAARPDPEVASVLETAARSARARGATVTAVDLAEESARLTPDADRADARRRRFLAADLHALAGSLGRANELLRAILAESAPGAERAEALVKLGQIQPGRREPEALYEEALREASGDDRLEATIHLRLSGMQRWGRGVEVGAEHADLALRAAKRSGDRSLLAEALVEQACWQLRAGNGFPREQAEEALRLERTLPDWPRDFGAADNIAMELMWIVELEPARALLLELRDAHRRRDETPQEAYVLWILAMVEWRAGNWDAAEGYLRERVQLMSQLGEAPNPTADIPDAILAAHRGRVDEARALAEAGLAWGEASGIGISVSGYLGVLGFLELSLGNAEKAVDHLRRSHDVRNVFMREPAQHFELGDYLEALVAVGELDEADRLLSLWEGRARAVDRAWALAILARCRALLLAAQGDLDRALAGFEEALAEHARTTDPFQHARTLLAHGRTQRRAKRRAAARATLADALGRFEQLRAPLWAEQARAELDRIGGRRAAADGLTDAEQRIAALVAQGRSNREVAAALYLTVHSVETALTRIYRKLGVRSRAELAGRYSTTL